MATFLLEELEETKKEREMLLKFFIISQCLDEKMKTLNCEESSKTLEIEINKSLYKLGICMYLLVHTICANNKVFCQELFNKISKQNWERYIVLEQVLSCKELFKENENIKLCHDYIRSFAKLGIFTINMIIMHMNADPRFKREIKERTYN